MKVLVVGGAGYIGSHAVYELIRAGHEAVIYDNLSTGFESLVHKDATFYLGDTLDATQFANVFRIECAKRPFDVVMHFAAKLIVPESMEQPLEYYHNNVEGVRVMLETMRAFGIKNVIFSSTAAVYGEPEEGVCTERTPLNPINPYGASKRAAEELIRWTCQAHNMKHCIFRYFNVAGADSSLEIGLRYDRITHLIPVTIQTALGIRERMTIFGQDYPTVDGTCVRDYVHVTDLVRAHIMGAEHLLSGGESITCNLGTGTGFSVKQIVEAVQKHLPVNHVYGPRRPGDPGLLVADPTRAKEVLGWEPRFGLDEIIASDLAFRQRFMKGSEG